jgi:CubicO group peptidase (beta-lactamase class C family)
VVTVRQLLSHRSGYYDPIHDDPDFVPYLAGHMDTPWTWSDMLDLAFQHELFFQPGSEYRYSNTNYMLLGLVVEEVSGRSLGETLMSDLVVPLGLDHTYYATPETETGDSSLARGYITHPLSGEIVNSASIPYKTILSTSADTMVSNATDLLKWARMLYGEESLVIEPDFQKQMLTFDSMRPYGLGVFQFDTPIGKSIGHGGDTAGYLSLMEYLPEQELSIVILVNADAPHINLSQLRNSLLTVLFPDLGYERVKELLSDLQSEDATTRRNAIVALGHSTTRSPEVISGLIDVLSLDQSSENRKEAALALGLVGRDSEAARQALTSALQDGNSTVREAAQLALSLLK